MRNSNLCLFLLIFIFGSQSLNAQVVADENQILRQLLDLPAPAKSKENNDKPRKSVADKYAAHDVFYSRQNPPPDDAPWEDFALYWKKQAQKNYGRWDDFFPSDQSARRLFDFCRASEEPEDCFSDFVFALPDKPEFVGFLENLAAEILAKDEDATGEIQDWLGLNSRQHALKNAAEMRADLGDDEVDINKDILGRGEFLLALAALDWDAARYFVDILIVAAPDSPNFALPAAMRYEHAVAEKDQAGIAEQTAALKKIVENKSAHNAARNAALEILLRRNFDNQAEWFWTLFADESWLRDAEADSDEFPLYLAITDDPDKFVPSIIKLINHENPVVHNAAVRALLPFADGWKDARHDALAALLPWLDNPKWAQDTPDGERRADFIETLNDVTEEVPLPESIPGFIWIIANDANDKNHNNAASALEDYRDNRAAPVLRASAERQSARNLRSVLNALIACGGLSETETLDALKLFYAAPKTNAETASEFLANVGKHTIKYGLDDENVGSKWLELIAETEKNNSELAQKMFSDVNRWSQNWARLAVVRRAAENRADVSMLIRILAGREFIKETFAAELGNLKFQYGAARTLGAILRDDAAKMNSILQNGAANEKIALLAFARLLRLNLSVSQTAKFFDEKNGLLALAAERYLETEDSPAAQKIVRARHPNDFYISGASDAFNPRNADVHKIEFLTQLFASVNADYDDFLFLNQRFTLSENKLIEQIKRKNNLLELFALINYDGSATIIQVFNNQSVLTIHKPNGRTHERNLAAAELKKWHAELKQISLENVSAVIVKSSGYEGMAKQFVALNCNGGRRVFGSRGFSTHLSKIDSALNLLSESKEWRMRYSFENKIKNLETLLTGEDVSVKAIWKNAADFRVFVEQKTTNGGNQISGAKWRGVKNGTLDAIVKQPPQVPFLRGENGEAPEIKELNNYQRAWKTRLGNDEIRAVNHGDSPGLWRVNSAGEKIRMLIGRYDSPLTTPNGKWIIVSKKDDKRGYNSEYLVRVNTETFGEDRIPIAEDRAMKSIAFVPEHQKFLIKRGESEAEYFLVDAETGAATAVSGEFRPLEQQTFRRLQSAGKPDLFWAAIPNRDADKTVIGLYDAQKFTFQSQLELPETNFDSMNFWFDEKDNKFYFIHAENLFAVPNLPTKDTK